MQDSRAGTDTLPWTWPEDLRACPSRRRAGNPFAAGRVPQTIMVPMTADSADVPTFGVVDPRVQALVEHAPIGMYVSTRNGAFQWINTAFVRMLGYDSQAELLAVPLHHLYRNPEMRDRVMRQFEAAGNLAGIEVEWRRRDGRPITLRLRGRIAAGRNGGEDAFEVIAEDVTERRVLEEQLRLSQKMEAIGRLAGGIAHDFNNMLTAILGYSETLLLQLDEQKPIWRDLTEIRSAAERAAVLTRQLLTFSRQQVLRLEPVDLNAIVRQVEQMIRRLIGENIAVDTRLAPGPCTIVADRSQLEQAIVNLAVNARDAMPSGGRLAIETAVASLDAEYIGQHPVVTPGRYALLAVCDNGLGMDAATKAKIFDPFFTTKELGKGTGLGLSTVYGTVKQLGGYIWVYSEPGVGTSFKLYFPESSQVEVSGAAPAAAHAVPSVGTEAVLVVEDERAVRAFCCTVLRRFGYHVMEAASPAEALSILDVLSLHVDLILTDVMMPGMSGSEMIQRVRTTRPHVKTLYMSGYGENLIALHRHVEAGVKLIEKPFTSADLLREVRLALDPPAVRRAS
jgi:two-component system, cell cycle sensor histidine kinase and response regulator CckA